MRTLFKRLQTAPRRIRVPVKLTLFLFVCLGVLYPRPGLLIRQFHRIRTLQELPDPQAVIKAGVLEEFEQFLASRPARERAGNPNQEMMAEVEAFVCKRIPYAWDWDVWGVVDYVPTVTEVLARGREDCDGRAVLAASILQAKGIDAQLVADPRHMWVRTPAGDTMHPLGTPTILSNGSQTQVQWAALLNLGPLAFGIAVFPFGRELIILLAAWGLLLPADATVRQAVFTVLLLIEALILMRLAGRNPLAPQMDGIYWALLHIGIANLVLVWPRSKKQQTGRYDAAGEQTLECARMFMSSPEDSLERGTWLPTRQVVERQEVGS